MARKTPVKRLRTTRQSKGIRAPTQLSKDHHPVSMESLSQGSSLGISEPSEERKSEESAVVRMESSAPQEVPEEDPLPWSPLTPVYDPKLFLEDNNSIIINNNLLGGPSSTVDVPCAAPSIEPSLQGNKRKRSSRSKGLPMVVQTSDRERGNNFSDPLIRDPNDFSLDPSQNSQEFGVQDKDVTGLNSGSSPLAEVPVPEQGNKDFSGDNPPAPFPFSKHSPHDSVGNNEFPRQSNELIRPDQEERTGRSKNPIQEASNDPAPAGYSYSNKSIYNAKMLELNNANNSNNLILNANQIKARNGPDDWTLRHRGPVFSAGNAGKDGVVRKAHWFNEQGEHFVTPWPYQRFNEVTGIPILKSAIPDSMDLEMGCLIVVQDKKFNRDNSDFIPVRWPSGAVTVKNYNPLHGVKRSVTALHSTTVSSTSVPPARTSVPKNTVLPDSTQVPTKPVSSTRTVVPSGAAVVVKPAVSDLKKTPARTCVPQNTDQPIAESVNAPVLLPPGIPENNHKNVSDVLGQKSDTVDFADSDEESSIVFRHKKPYISEFAHSHTQPPANNPITDKLSDSEVDYDSDGVGDSKDVSSSPPFNPSTLDPQFLASVDPLSPIRRRSAILPVAPGNFVVQSRELKLVKLDKLDNRDLIKKWIRNARNELNSMDFNLWDSITVANQQYLPVFIAGQLGSEAVTQNGKVFQSLVTNTPLVFLKLLEKACMGQNKELGKGEFLGSLDKLLITDRFPISGDDRKSLFYEINMLIEQFDVSGSERYCHKQIIKRVKFLINEKAKGFFRNNQNVTAGLFHTLENLLNEDKSSMATWFEYFSRLEHHCCNGIEKSLAAAKKLDPRIAAIIDETSHPIANKSTSKPAAQSNKAIPNYNTSKGSNNQSSNQCKGCGGSGHDASKCHLRDHPDWNHDHTIHWKDSVPGKQWTARRKLTTVFLPKSVSLDGTWKLPDHLKSKSSRNETSSGPKVQVQGSGKQSNSNKNKLHSKGNLTYASVNTTLVSNAINVIDNNRQTVSMQLYVDTPNLTLVTLPNTFLTVNVLLDTGCLQGNYISSDVADWLEQNGNKRRHCNNQGGNSSSSSSNTSSNNAMICSGIGHNMCISCKGLLDLALVLHNEMTNSLDLIKLSDTTIIESSFSIIIGLNSIRRLCLFEKCYSFFVDIGTDTKPPVSRFHHDTRQRTAAKVESPNCDLIQWSNVITNVNTKRIFTKDELLTPITDDQGILDDDISPPWEEFDNPKPSNESDRFPKVATEGRTLHFHKAMSELCKQYSDVFATVLGPTSAKVPPMEIIYDHSIWKQNKNKGPARRQSTKKEEIVKREIDSLLAWKCIRKSDAEYYSQIHLVPKPGEDNWRLTIDYRNANEATTRDAWPLPNIDGCLRRIHGRGAMIFGVLDLTKGFWQCPLSANSRAFTAFICFMGVYEWLRVPMGLKGSPSYFQGILATVVFAALMYRIMELYIDDIIIYGANEDEFIQNCEVVFQRLRKHNLTVNPKKGILGASKIEYVGHTLDSSGITFSREKVQEVIDFSIPTTAKHLRSFLGLASYFRDHIQNLASIERGMRDVLDVYTKSQKKFCWTPEAQKAFEDVKKAINACPKLFFLNVENSQIFLHTDASDYGIGAYLFQVIDGVEQPIIFISKALHKEQLRWSTIEKECYAIYFSFKKLKHLIRDIKFTLRTDHLNLLYLNENTAKVSRWKLEIQEYDFNIEHIPGHKNIAADGFSRLCPIVPLTWEEENSLVSLVLAVGTEQFETPDEYSSILRQVHNVTVGHHGVERTLKKLTALLGSMNKKPWRYMREHVRSFIKKCPCCQKMSFIKPLIHTHPFTNSTYVPWQRLGIDTIGPFPPDEYGNTYILHIQDTMSRFSVLYPLKGLSANEAARCLIHLFGNFGTPAQIYTDNGTQFDNSIQDELVRFIGCEHLTSIAYSKEELMVERGNKEVNRHLRDIIFDLRVENRWSDYLPFIQRIINSTVTMAHGATPAEIVFGNSVQLDRGIFLPYDAIANEEGELTTQEHQNIFPDKPSKRLSEWLDAMLKNQAKVIQKVAYTLRKHNEVHIANATSDRTEFSINSYVLCTYPDSAMGPKPPSKIHPILEGPFRVVNFIGSTYTIQNIVTFKNKTVHISRLRKFEYDPNTTNLEDVALRDIKEYHVENILQHQGNFKTKKFLKFLVKWTGYDESENSWVSWHELRSNEQLHQYLIRNGLQFEIPKEFRENYDAAVFRRARHN